MKLISLVKEGDSYYGWLDRGDEYIQFSVTSGAISLGPQSHPKKEFRNYEHFVGVMSKFDPYTFFQEQPIKLKKFTAQVVQEIWEKIKVE